MDRFFALEMTQHSDSGESQTSNFFFSVVALSCNRDPSTIYEALLDVEGTIGKRVYISGD